MTNPIIETLLQNIRDVNKAMADWHQTMNRAIFLCRTDDVIVRTRKRQALRELSEELAQIDELLACINGEKPPLKTILDAYE